MILNAMEAVCARSNAYMKDLYKSVEDLVIFSGIVNQDGSENPNIAGKLSLSLYNIMSEPAGRAPDNAANAASVFDVSLMFAAATSMSAYAEGVKLISGLLGYLQTVSVFTRANAPELSPDIGEVTLELENLNRTELSQVMALLDTRYAPSLFYKMRIVSSEALGAAG